MTFWKNFSLIVLLSIIMFLADGQRQGEAQQSARFGKNKVHYKDFKWATLETTHFIIHFYRGEEQLARNTEKMVERAYTHLSSTLRHEFLEKIPLIIYASSDDFQQTEVIRGFLGEGIGGVTEGLRGRIVIPFLGSYRSFNHVLIHELVHAFQFDILSKGKAAINIFAGGESLPLWFMEGMAEYLSEYTNPITEMWLYDAVYHETLPSVKQIESMMDIRVYRFGQSLFSYICKTYGDQIIGDLLREIAENGSWGKAIQKTANTSWKAIYEAWLKMVKNTYSSSKPGLHPIKDQATLLISHKKDVFSLNIIPTVSPDGKYVAFISDRNFYRTIYLASAETGKIIKKLVEGERRGTYETLRFLNTSVAWSPDSQHIAFNAKAGGENAIYLLNIHSKKIVKKLAPNVTSLSFLTWSPDGQTIAFTGTRNGQEDLFLIHIGDGKLEQLTNDLFSNRHPAWSSDGTAIAFTTDAGKFSNLAELEFGPSNLAVYNIEDKTTTLLTDNAANDLTPVWSPDGTMLAFISDRSGLYNIYLLEIESAISLEYIYRVKRTVRLTNVNTGIVGLTEDNPALTWAKERGTLLFSGFSDKGWDIFSLRNPATIYREYLTEVGFEQEQMFDQEEESFSETTGKKDWAYTLPETESSRIKDYKARVTPEYIFGGGGGTNKDFIILGRLGFSDMLSNHRLSVGFNITSVFDESDFLVEYSNRSHRLSYELSAFQFGGDLGTYTMKNRELDVEVERGIGINFLWPFDKFGRLEFGIEGRMVSGDQIEEDETETEKIDDQFFVTPVVSYVHDTVLYTPIGPLDGWRSRYSIHPAIGDFTYVTLAADQRWYLQFSRRSTLALRVLTAGSFGENAQVFKLRGANTFRGIEYNDTDAIQGSKIALGSIEYRFPLLPKVNILRGNIFWDMAVGWTDTVQPFTTKDADLFRLQDLRGAYGAGIRIPIYAPFGLFNFRLDIAQETDLTRNIGERKILFSISNDF